MAAFQHLGEGVGGGGAPHFMILKLNIRKKGTLLIMGFLGSPVNTKLRPQQESCTIQDFQYVCNLIC